MVTSEPPVTENEKREALDAALNSQTFARSAQLRALLRYICEREMAGHSEGLTEYQIAVEVLGRRKDFSLTDDSSVRNRAYELRQRLEKLYASEQPTATVLIQIPRGGYVPYYTRRHAAQVAEAPAADSRTDIVPAGVCLAGRPHGHIRWILPAVAVGCLLAGVAGGWWLFGRSSPDAVLQEAWGPLASRGDNLLISIATNMHMLIRPHIAPHSWRLAAPKDITSIYGAIRPLDSDETLYMEPAQLSVPLAELASVAALTNVRTAFGGTYQILPESEAPVAALRGRNSVLIGSGTNSQSARVLLKNLPFTIDYTKSDLFAVYDQRKPVGQNEIFVTETTGQPVPAVSYGLLSVITAADSAGNPKRTVVLSGSSSAGVQAAAEFFCSPSHTAKLKERFKAAGLSGFPAVYQVVVRCKTAGLRLISYDYAAHEIVQK